MESRNRHEYQDNHESYHQPESHSHPLKRISIDSEDKQNRLERHEIGIKSGLKGVEIKQYVDRAIYKLIYTNTPKVTLKAVGNLI